MANIVILSLVFPPDSVSTAQIMADLAQDLKRKGHSVAVLTTCPHYNPDLQNEIRQPLKPYWRKLLWKSDYNGIPVYHVWMPKKSGSKTMRILAWLWFHFMSTIAGMRLADRADIVIAPSPPLTIGLSAWILARFFRANFIYNVQEIYPDIAVRLGALRNRAIINALCRLERFVYRRAAKITVIAPNMAAKLRHKGVGADKIRVIPNFVDTDFFHPLPKDNAFSRRHNVHDKFVISYAGNMGPAQGLEHFIEAAGLLRHEPGLVFLMMGAGISRVKLADQVQRLKLSSFFFLPYQPYELMPMIYAASDLSLVPLAPEAGDEAVPSKVYRIMACERALLVAADTNSDLANLANTVQCGFVVPPASAQALSEAVLAGYRQPDLLREMGRRGCDHIRECYARPAVTAQYDDLIRELTGEK